MVLQNRAGGDRGETETEEFWLCVVICPLQEKELAHWIKPDSTGT